MNADGMISGDIPAMDKAATDALRAQLIAFRDALNASVAKALDHLDLIDAPHELTGKSLRTRLLRALHDEGGAASPGTLRSYVHCHPDTIRAALLALEAQGVVYRTGSGPRNVLWHLGQVVTDPEESKP